MRRRVVYGLSAGLILVLLFLSCAVVWVLGTSAGARWIMAEVSSHTSVTLEAKLLKGRIWGDLRLGSMDVRWPEGTLHAESLQIRWSPLRLLYGKVAVREFILDNVHVQDNRPETPSVPEIVWPHVTGLLSRIDANVDVFRISGATYRRLKEDPVVLSNISGRIGWRNGILTVRELKTDSRFGKTDGTLQAGLFKPSLSMKIAVMPADTLAGLDTIEVDARLRARHVSGPLKGDIHVTGSSGTTARIEFRSGLELDRDAVRLIDCHVTQFVRSGSVKGSGEIKFSEAGPRFHLVVDTSGLDLSPFLNSRTDVSSRLVLEGTASHYHGQLDLSNKGDSLRTIRLSGSLQGDKKGLQWTSVDGSWLGGKIDGTVHAGWEKGFSFRTSLRMRDLDPSLVSPGWTGRINADASASALMTTNKPVSASFSARLLESSLRDRVLTGEVKAGLTGNNLLIDRLLLRGKGFNVKARGELLKRITFTADISDLSGLVPGARGALHAAGWVGWPERLLTGNIEGRVRRIKSGDLSIGAGVFTAHISGTKGSPFQLRTTVTQLVFDSTEIRSADFRAGGTLADHVIKLDVVSPGAKVDAELSGGYEGGRWLGRIYSLSEKDSSGELRLDAPSDLLISGEEFSLSQLVLNGSGGERFEAAGKLKFHPLEGSLDVQWADLDLGRADYWLSDVKVGGKSSGKIHAQWLRNVLYRVSANAEASGTFVTDGQKIVVSHALMRVDRVEQRLFASFDIETDRAATLKGHFSSLIKSGAFLPAEGEIGAELHGLDLALFRRWIPEGVEVAGRADGNFGGKLVAENHLDITGGVSISGGIIRRHTENGEISVQVRKADMKFAWSNVSFKGTVTLVLQDYGQVEGSFEVPLAASLPPSVEGNGPVNISMKGQIHEKGLLTALFPGLLQETHGRIDFGIKVDGVWKAPDLKGTVSLSQAGAYFPAGGIHIKDAGMTAHLEGDKLTIDSFQALSGSGKIEGTAEIRLSLKDRAVAGYKGTLRGKDFQVFYLPELRMEASPDISVEGSNKKLSVNGEIRIPYLLLLQSKTKPPVEPSSDVVIIDREKKPVKGLKTALNIRVRIVLGDRVLVKAEGIDAQLGGSVDVTATDVDDIRGRGEIHVVKGKYSAYGVSLDIQRGRVIFSGQPIDKPRLDVLALRKSGDVKAGVTVTGTLQKPVIQLYSDPAMSDTDVLAYIVLGHPLGGSQQQADLVARAAGFLLSASDSVVFQDQLKQRVGIDTLDIESTKTGQETGQESGREGLSRSLVTVGKYLTPALYISYGTSLMGDTNLFRVRYSLSRHWQLETESGTESGADLFYKIDLK